METESFSSYKRPYTLFVQPHAETQSLTYNRQISYYFCRLVIKNKPRRGINGNKMVDSTSKIHQARIELATSAVLRPRHNQLDHRCFLLYEEPIQYMNSYYKANYNE